jgi:hypothetical protein
MNELERGLAALGPELELPPEPDLAPAVLARLEERGGRPFPWRRAAIALALVAVAIAAAFAVPEARSTILGWFHLRGATVERVETLPPAVERSQAGGLGQPSSLAEAERIVGFELALPPFDDGGPNRVYVLDGVLASVIVHAHGRSVLLSEFRSSDLEFLKKVTDAETSVEPVRIDGDPGLWVEGPRHALIYPGASGEPRTILIHGNVLLWVHGDLTLRLEGKLTREQALQLARAIR